MNVNPLYHTKLLELRSMKDFAAICQFLHFFHPAFALEDFDTEELEQALVDPSQMPYLVDLQARMLRQLTQDRRISFDNWIQYAQKEFEKREDDQNPWLKESSYEDFDLTSKLLVLTNLCEWQLDDPERFRSKFKQEEEVAMDWRVDPIGHDSLERTYWLFDDNRLYRENPPPKKVTKKSKQPVAPPKPKPKPVARRGTRRSGRHNTEPSPEPEPEPEPEHETPPVTPGVEWEPVCITRQDWEEFANVFKRSKHPDEKALHTLINNDVLPKVLDEFMEREKEREKLEAIANRKRSSRIVIREFELQEKARLDAIRQQEIHEQAERRKQELKERRAEKERLAQQQIRDNRLKEREQRLKDRENAIWEREEKKKQQQQRIAKEREERKKRRLNGTPMKGDHSEDEGTSHQGDEEEEDDWFFDCVCGVHGNNLDDGELMIACEKCNVWQHVACLKEEDKAHGRSTKDWSDFDFICPRCIVKEQKKVARKEKKEQKQKMEALAAASAQATLATADQVKHQRQQPPMAQNAFVPAPQAPMNGYYHPSQQHLASSVPVQRPAQAYSATAPHYAGQPYQQQQQQQTYANPTPYHPNSNLSHAPQPYHNGHSAQALTPSSYAYHTPQHQQQHPQHPQHLQHQNQQHHQQQQQQQNPMYFQPPPPQQHPSHHHPQPGMHNGSSYGSSGGVTPSTTFGHVSSNASNTPVQGHGQAQQQQHPVHSLQPPQQQPQARQQVPYSTHATARPGPYPTPMSPPIAPQQQPVHPQQHQQQQQQPFQQQQQFSGPNGTGVVVQKRVQAEDGMMEGIERPHKLPNQKV
ncbi:hypothetical protein EMPS_02026 [Entomortierella parvispora]|uniref:DDT domain-containing protein n=1 Tax=Entomortierella parvispora TaxID=205924 RepID=A0A9P3H401_9FUNG|nr:hypothetical protein EMPS_02026 [Entomortierella parvispora]